MQRSQNHTAVKIFLILLSLSPDCGGYHYCHHYHRSAV
nr:MAG TPA: hypothetical protein [Caudoviricetes sp.]